MADCDLLGELVELLGELLEPELPDCDIAKGCRREGASLRCSTNKNMSLFAILNEGKSKCRALTNAIECDF